MGGAKETSRPSLRVRLSLEPTSSKPDGFHPGARGEVRDADITDARSIPQELMAIVPALPSVTVQPLLLSSQREYGMFEHFRRFPCIPEPFLYEDQAGLLAAITDKVIRPAGAGAEQELS
jgi:hypothetical protein